jgi:hypothetical protein
MNSEIFRQRVTSGERRVEKGEFGMNISDISGSLGGEGDGSDFFPKNIFRLLTKGNLLHILVCFDGHPFGKRRACSFWDHFFI